MKDKDKNNIISIGGFKKKREAIVDNPEMYKIIGAIDELQEQMSELSKTTLATIKVLKKLADKQEELEKSLLEIQKG